MTERRQPYNKERSLTDLELTWLLDQYYNTINERIGSLTEADLWRALDLERQGHGRPFVLIRLHQRYTVLRKTRERHELLNAAGSAPAPGTTED
jgi:hypothetical protein